MLPVEVAMSPIRQVSDPGSNRASLILIFSGNLPVSFQARQMRVSSSPIKELANNDRFR